MNTVKHVVLLLSILGIAFSASAQHTFRAILKDEDSKTLLPGVMVADKKGHGGVTNDSGRVVISNINSGTDTFFFTFMGYKADSIISDFHENKWQQILLTENGKELYEVLVLSSTRNNERMENAPVKVEVFGKEDLEEENTIKPANITGLIGDVSGVQIQQSSATSGNMNVRIQGLGGQYTQILRDGMPLFDGFSGGFGILQIPPLDLRQIELIKGSASTLYGGGAIAGLVNLLSKRPGDDQEAIFTLNVTTLQEQDVNAYLSKRDKKFGYTLFAGYTHQNAVDVNGDGLSDVPQLNTFTIHPRFFYYPDEKTTLIVGYDGTFEKRFGGDMQVIDGFPDSLHQYYEKDITQRNTGELIFERSLPGLIKLTIKGSLSSFNRDIESNTDNITGNQVNYYSEASVFIPQKNNSIAAGINAVGDDFKKLPGSDSIALNDFQNNTFGAFVQYTLHLSAQTTLDGGLRGDYTDRYGSFMLPRIAFFHRFNDKWATRAGAGAGYKVPNPLEVQLVDYPIQDLQPLPIGIKAEKSMGYNLEGNFKKNFGDDINLFINHAFFLTQITDPIVAAQFTDQQVFFTNGDRPLVTMGFDTYAKLTIEKLEVYLGYTYTDAERKYLSQNQFLPLTPRNRFAFTAARPFGKKWRVGIEGSYISMEYRDGYPNARPYYLTSLMIERKLNKKCTLVMNGENLLNVRQTNFEQIYTGPITDPVFKPLYAPIDGRVINLSIKVTPFNK